MQGNIIKYEKSITNYQKVDCLHIFLFLFDSLVSEYFTAVYLLRPPIGGFNSVALSSVFYTGFKTMRRNEFSFTAQPIILE